MDMGTSLAAGVILGSIGLGYFMYGKKQGHKLALWCGLLLMALPVFFDSLLWLSLAALTIMLAPKYVKF